MMCDIIRNKITSFPVQAIVQLNRFGTFLCIYMKRQIKQTNKKKKKIPSGNLCAFEMFMFLKMKRHINHAP